MASDAQRDVMRFKHEAKLKKAELAQQERASKRQAGANVLSSIGSSVIKAVATKANDANWYKQWIDLQLVANIPEFNDVTIMSNRINKGTISTPTGQLDSYGVPLIAMVRYLPTLGHSYHDRTSMGATTAGFFTGCNQALSKMLSQIGKANSRSVSGSTEAIGFYLTLAVDLASLLARLNTNIAMVSTFNPEMTRIREAYFKAALYDGTGVRTSYFINNVAQWRKIYAEFAARFNAEIVIPKDLSLLKRRVWLASTLLKDLNISKGQIWGFQQEVYRGIDTTNNVLDPLIDSCLGTGTAPGLNFTDGWLFENIAQFRMYIEHVFFELSKANTYKELVSNMRACIPPSDLAQFDVEPLKEPMVIGISDEVLSQIHNLEIPFGFVTNSTGSLSPVNVTDLAKVYTDGDQIYERNASIIYYNVASTTDEYKIARAFNNLSDPVLRSALSMYKSGVNADDVAVATRLHPLWHCELVQLEGSSNYAIYLYIDSCGTEVPSSIVCIEADNAGALTTLYVGSYVPWRSADAVVAADFALLSTASKFDWCPPVSIVNAFSVSGSISFYTINDIGNVYPLLNEDLQRIHEACVKSEFYTDPTIYKKTM